METLNSTLQAAQGKSVEKLHQRLARRRDQLQRDLQMRQQAETQVVAKPPVSHDRIDEPTTTVGEDIESKQHLQDLKQQHERTRVEEREALAARQVRNGEAHSVPNDNEILHNAACYSYFRQVQQKAKLQERLAAKKALREAEIVAQQARLTQAQQQQHSDDSWRAALLQDIQLVKEEGYVGRELEDRVFSRNVPR